MNRITFTYDKFKTVKSAFFRFIYTEFTRTWSKYDNYASMDQSSEVKLLVSAINWLIEYRR